MQVQKEKLTPLRPMLSCAEFVEMYDVPRAFRIPCFSATVLIAVENVSLLRNPCVLVGNIEGHSQTPSQDQRVICY